MEQSPERSAVPLGAFVRDGSIAWWVHLGGLAVAGLSLGLSLGGVLVDEPGYAVLSVGCSSGFIAVLWSVVLAWRGTRGGGSSNSAIWMSYVVLTELTWLSIALWTGDYRHWCAVRSEWPFSILINLGFPIVLFISWIGASAALVGAWWWVWRRKRDAREALTPAEQGVARLRTPAGRVFMLALLSALLLLPFGLILMAATSPWRGCVPAWTVRVLPASVQRQGMRLSYWVTNDRPLDAEFTRGRYVRDEVLVWELDQRLDDESLVDGLAELHSDAFLAWMRRAVFSKDFRTWPVCGHGLPAIAARYPVGKLKEFLEWMASNRPEDSFQCAFVKGLSSRNGDELSCLVEGLAALRGRGWQAKEIVAETSDILPVGLRRRYWGLKCGNASAEEREVLAEALKYAQHREGLDDAFCALLGDFQAKVRKLTFESYFYHYWIWPGRYPASTALVERFLQLTGNPDLETRRCATDALSHWLRRGITHESERVETPAELAVRSSLIQVVREQLAKNQRQ